MKYNHKNYDYLIVGSGPYGAIFAYEAAQRGKKCLVIEKRNHIGGNLYTDKQHGINVHKYGAHIFHTNSKEIWQYINQFSEFNHYINQVIANYKGELYNLPFNMNTFYQMWGVKTPAEAKAKIAEQQMAAGLANKPKNLEEQAIQLIGTDIYEKLIKGYTQKQWGKDPKELPSFIIRRLPTRFTFDNNYFNHSYQGVPVDGYTPIFDRLLASENIDVLLNQDFLTDKETYLKEFPKVIYTGMIDAFFDYEYGLLDYRSLSFKSEIIETDNAQGNAVINYTDSETPYTRSMEWRHFDGQGDKNITIVTKEYPQEWDPSREAYYPLNDEKNTALFKRYRKKAKEQSKVIFGGRLGNYQYYDMDQVISAALHAVRIEFGE